MERVNDSKNGESLKSHRRMLILILHEYKLRFAIISIIVSVLAIVIWLRTVKPIEDDDDETAMF